MATNEKQMYTAGQLVERLNLSDKYLRRLMTHLSKAQLIRSIQGRDGGYIFAKPTNEIYLFDIVSAVDDMNKYIGCVLGFESCSDQSPCSVHNKWAEARKPILQMFTTTTLSEIVKDSFIGKF